MPDERITVYYPSGPKMKFFGRFEKHGPLMDNDPDSPYSVAITVLGSTTIGDTTVSAGNVMVVDPRCVVVGESSGLLYTPRPHVHLFPPGMKDWMEKHGEWPGYRPLPARNKP